VLEGIKTYRIYPPGPDASAALLFNDLGTKFEMSSAMVWGERLGASFSALPHPGWRVEALRAGELLYHLRVISTAI
jgi:hypothetical protein